MTDIKAVLLLCAVILATVAAILVFLIAKRNADMADEFVAQANVVKENHGTKVVVSPAYYWEPISTAPLGCKLQLKPIPGGVATYGEVTERNRKYFSHWAPLPTTLKVKP